MKVLLALAIAGALLTGAPRAQQQQANDAPAAADSAPVLAPTNHPQVPAALSELWLAPERAKPSRSAALNEFASAVQAEVDANYAKALPILSQPALQQGPLGQYATLYKGLAELRLNRAADARTTFQNLQAEQPVGYVAEVAALREAEADEALGDQAAALAIYERLSNTKTTAPDDVLMRLGRAAKAVGDRAKAATAFSRVYYEFPLSDLSALASSELDALGNIEPIAPGNTRYQLELGRAQRLFGSKRYAEARSGFDGLKNAASDDDRELIALRRGECDYFLKRPRNARDEVRPYIEKAARQAEALFFFAVASRDLGNQDDYRQTVQRLVNDFPAQSWTEEALNNLATHDILQSDDEGADGVFRTLHELFPAGRYAERAAWKIGWLAYKNRRYADTIRVFESAAAAFPRSDYRPPWIYWAGRAREAQHDKLLAGQRFELVVTDYLNSYYGRLAVKRLDGRAPQRRLVVDTRPVQGVPAQDEAAASTALPANERVVRALLGLELYDQAIDELKYAQKVWGDSPVIQATLGWIYHERGDLRPGINAMKRAYPQYIAAGGEKLPPELLKVLFPVNYWPLIRRYSMQHDLDPYMMAALIAQESTFEEDAKSAANAYGLMQLLPSTGRRYAKKLKMRFSMGMLKKADPNIKMGTAYFADLVKQFGGTHYALASYNAGESRIVRWKAERGDIDREEFIDDIPFPETQNYVKKVLGTAEDYRRLYAGEGGRPAEEGQKVAPAGATPAKAAATPKRGNTKHRRPHESA